MHTHFASDTAYRGVCLGICSRDTIHPAGFLQLSGSASNQGRIYPSDVVSQDKDLPRCQRSARSG